MNPNDCENWIVWGVILKTVGNYKSAKNKYEQALKIDPTNETAQEELEMIDEIRRHKLIMEKVALKIKNRTITTALSRWVEMVEERNDMRILVTRALGRITRQVESAGFKTWVRVWQFQRRMDNSDFK